MVTTLDGPAVINAKARYWSKIAIFAPVRDNGRIVARMADCRRISATSFGMEKLELCGYPRVIRFDTVHKRDKQLHASPYLGVLWV